MGKYIPGNPQVVQALSNDEIDVGLLPAGTAVLLQSNNYFSEPGHVSCMHSLAQFAAAAQLAEVLYSGELPAKNYTRFMLIGRV